MKSMCLLNFLAFIVQKCFVTELLRLLIDVTCNAQLITILICSLYFSVLDQILLENDQIKTELHNEYNYECLRNSLST